MMAVSTQRRQDMRRTAVAILAILALALGSMPARAASTPVKVLGGPGEQYWPSSNGTHLAWSDWDGHRTNEYVKVLATGITKKVNAAGTFGATGSFVGTSDVLVYQQWGTRRPSDIYFYDVSARTRTKAPVAVNTPGMWEGLPMASDAYLVFKRSKYSASGKLLNNWLILYDRNTHDTTTLAKGLKTFIPSFAGATYVAWTVCGSVTCTVFYWSVGGGTHAVPSVTGKAQYDGVIDEVSSQIYYVRSSANACGRFVTFRRSSIGSSTSTVLGSLPAGFDAGFNLSLSPNPVTTHEDLFFERWACKAESGDIYKFRSVDTA
jgi:hypothetical protein